jgi:hypothetical protein
MKQAPLLVSAISKLLLMDSLLMIDPVLLAVILDLVESSSKCMKETERYNLAWRRRMPNIRDLRADDTKYECSPRQVARVVSWIGVSTSDIVTSTIAQTRRVVAVPRTSQSATGPRKDSDGNESTNEQQVHKYPDPPQCSASRIRALLDATEQHADESV